MTKSEIEAYMAVYEEKNISKAADKMYISQPSLSAKISNLEKKLGYTLFVRKKGMQNIQITEKGEKFHELALLYLNTVQKMYALKEENNDHLRICTTNSIGHYLLTFVYEHFIKTNPDIKIEMQDAETKAAYQFIESGYMDIAFSPIKQEHPNIIYETIFKEKLVFVCRKEDSYPSLIRKEEIDLSNEVFVQWDYDYMKWHKEMFGSNTINKIHVEMMSQMEYFLSKENSWAFVPLSIALYLTKHQNLCIKSCDFQTPYRTIGYIYDKNSNKMALMQSFVNAFKEIVNEIIQ